MSNIDKLTIDVSTTVGEYMAKAVKSVFEGNEVTLDEIKMNVGFDGIVTDIVINGQRLKGVRSFKLEQKAGEIPKLYLDLNALNLTVDGSCLTVLPEAYENFGLVTKKEPTEADSL